MEIGRGEIGRETSRVEDRKRRSDILERGRKMRIEGQIYKE